MSRKTGTSAVENEVFLVCLTMNAFLALFGRHQPLVRATEGQLYSKNRCGQDVDLPGFNFLQISRGNFRAFGQFILSPTPADAFTAHIRAEHADSLPFFPDNGHDILHRYLTMNMNDTYIVKIFQDLLAKIGKTRCNRFCKGVFFVWLKPLVVKIWPDVCKVVENRLSILLT